MPSLYQIRDAQYSRYLVAGDQWDGCVYHQDPNGRLNSYWAMMTDTAGITRFRDMKHGYFLVDGESFFVQTPSGTNYPKVGDFSPSPADLRCQWEFQGKTSVAININNQNVTVDEVALSNKFCTSQNRGNSFLYSDGSNQGLQLGSSNSNKNARWQLIQINAPRGAPFPIARLNLGTSVSPNTYALSYFVDTTIQPQAIWPDRVIACIDAAVAKWVAGFGILGITLNANRVQSGSGANIVFKWDSLSGSQASEGAFVDNSGGSGTWVEISGPRTVTFNQNLLWWGYDGRSSPGQYSLISIATHELGHIFGIDHCDWPLSFMQPKIVDYDWSELPSVQLGPYDLNRLWARYADYQG